MAPQREAVTASAIPLVSTANWSTEQQLAVRVCPCVCVCVINSAMARRDMDMMVARECVRVCVSVSCFCVTRKEASHVINHANSLL